MLTAIWNELRLRFFPDRNDLSEYTVSWSARRQRRVLASISLKRRVVHVARELDHPDHAHWLRPLLYHEMCHAVIGEIAPARGRKRMWHGREFKTLEQVHPEIPALRNWIKTGGWRRAVMSARARTSWKKRKSA